MKKLWKLHSNPHPSLPPELQQQYGLEPMVASILVRRGYTSTEGVQAFLQPALKQLRSPYDLYQMEEAVELLKSAILLEKRIVILGDYDVDGVTSTALMLLFLKSCGVQDLDFFIPNRFEHGYGLTHESVDVLLSMKPDFVITVDNGIVSKDEVARLQEAGVTTIITDHHLAQEDKLPECVIVNPNQPQCPYPFKGISGCGVALKVMMALRKVLREMGWWTLDRPEPNMKSYFDLAALGTVADVVPLVDENRLLVFHGLQQMNQQPRIGIQALSKVKRVQTIDAQTLSFQFAPLINAAGRMQDASIGVRLLLSDNEEQALDLAQQLDDVNQERRQREKEMLSIAKEQATAQEDRSSLVIASPHFHEGISGIVAARLVDQFYKPTLVFAQNGDHYKASGRSIPELHLKDTLTKCAPLLAKFGGHAMAAGCQVHEDQFDAFAQCFEEHCQTQLPQQPQPQLDIEGTLQWHQISEAFLNQLQCLAPFGAHNPQPLFAIDCPDFPFQTLKDVHIKWQCPPNIEIIGWNLAEAFSQQHPKQLAVTLGWNEFRGKRNIQLMIQDYR